MTLIPYSPTALDELALRLFDVAAQVRQMANYSRENSVVSVPLHGNKAQEWLGHLERWAFDGQGRLEAHVLRERGARRSQIGASNSPLPASSPPAQRTTKRRKKRT